MSFGRVDPQKEKNKAKIKQQIKKKLFQATKDQRPSDAGAPKTPKKKKTKPKLNSKLKRNSSKPPKTKRRRSTKDPLTQSP